MSYFIHFNDPDLVIDITGIDDLVLSPAPITIEDIDPIICRDNFTVDKIYNTVAESGFYIYRRNEEGVIVGLVTMTDYPIPGNHMMEITFICVAETARGTGSGLIIKIKEVARRYALPITLYGLATTPDSAVLYIKHKFIENKFTVSHGRKRKTKRKGKGKRNSKRKGKKVRKFELVIR